MGLSFFLNLALMATIFLPSVVIGDCLMFALCPYLQDSVSTSARYLALNDADLDGGTIEWTEIRVSGLENALGQAIVCIESSSMNEGSITSALSAVDCDIKTLSETRALLISPYNTRLNADTGEIEFLGEDESVTPISIPVHILDQIKGAE